MLKILSEAPAWMLAVNLKASGYHARKAGMFILVAFYNDMGS